MTGTDDMMTEKEIRKIVHGVLKEQHEAKSGYARFLEKLIWSLPYVLVGAITWGISTEVALRDIDRHLKSIEKSRFTNYDGLELETRMMSNISSRLDSISERMALVTQGMAVMDSRFSEIKSDVREIKDQVELLRR